MVDQKQDRVSQVERRKRVFKTCQEKGSTFEFTEVVWVNIGDIVWLPDKSKDVLHKFTKSIQGIVVGQSEISGKFDILMSDRKIAKDIPIEQLYTKKRNVSWETQIVMKPVSDEYDEEKTLLELQYKPNARALKREIRWMTKQKVSRIHVKYSEKTARMLHRPINDRSHGGVMCTAILRGYEFDRQSALEEGHLVSQLLQFGVPLEDCEGWLLTPDIQVASALLCVRKYSRYLERDERPTVFYGHAMPYVHACDTEELGELIETIGLAINKDVYRPKDGSKFSDFFCDYEGIRLETGNCSDGNGTLIHDGKDPARRRREWDFLQSVME